MKALFIILLLPVMVGCNSVYVQPNSIDTTQTFYADRGGYGMRRSIKQKMANRGYHVVVGTATASRDAIDNTENIEIDSAVVPDDARYIVKVSERRE